MIKYGIIAFETSWDFQTHPLVQYRHSVSAAEIDPDWSKLSYVIEEAYKSVRDVGNKEVQRLIDQLSQGYDDVQVDMDLDYTNHYWFIAISSVAYKQDLFAMNEEDIRNGKASRWSGWRAATPRTTARRSKSSNV